MMTLLPKFRQTIASMCHSIRLKPLDGQKQKPAEALFPGSVLESPDLVGDPDST